MFCLFHPREIPDRCIISHIEYEDILKMFIGYSFPKGAIVFSTCFQPTRCAYANIIFVTYRRDRCANERVVAKSMFTAKINVSRRVPFSIVGCLEENPSSQKNVLRFDRDEIPPSFCFCKF